MELVISVLLVLFAIIVVGIVVSKKDTTIKSINFTAFDFETATAKRMPCQLGVVVVRGGKIVEEKEWLIRPPENKYDRYCTQAHGIDSAITENSKEFYELWSEVLPYFENEVLVAHNIAFDKDVLSRAMYFYGVEDFREISYRCTCDIFNKGSLEDVTNSLGIELNSHHSAVHDARACAEIYLAYLNGADTNIIKSKKPKRGQNTHPNSYFDETRTPEEQEKRSLSREAKTQDLSIVENTNTIFYNKKVVISGELEEFPIREELALLLKGLGADINGSISRKTNIFIIGKDYGPVKMEKVEELNNTGCDITILTEEQLLAVLSD